MAKLKDKLYNRVIEGDLELSEEDIQNAGLANDSEKQDKLVSGENIKTINSQSLLGSGNISISGGTQFYKHTLYANGEVVNPFLELICTKNTAITMGEMVMYLMSHDVVQIPNIISFIGSESGKVLYRLVGSDFLPDSVGTISGLALKDDGTFETVTLAGDPIVPVSSISDTVTPL